MMDTVDWLNQKNCLRLLRPKWATFYAAWNQSEASKKQIGDQRSTLEDRFGGHDLGALVLNLDTYLKGDVKTHETEACLALMQHFWELDVKNSLDGVRWNTDSPIERACHAARKAVRDYKGAIVHRQYNSRVKEHKATEKTTAKAAKAEAQAAAKQTKHGIGNTLAEMRGMLEADD